MTHIEQFIKDAVEGGYKNEVLISGAPYITARMYGVNTARKLVHAHILLDPLAWQAVGKKRGWYEKDAHLPDWDEKDSIYMRMTDFVGALVDGKSIEDALAAIT